MNKTDYALWLIEKLVTEMLKDKPHKPTLEGLKDTAKELRAATARETL